jgi:hypothetical protein
MAFGMNGIMHGYYITVCGQTNLLFVLGRRMLLSDLFFPGRSKFLMELKTVIRANKSFDRD